MKFLFNNNIMNALEFKDISKVKAANFWNLPTRIDLCFLFLSFFKGAAQTLDNVVIVAPPQNATVVLGRPTVMECMAQGQPKPLVSWSRRGNTWFLVLPAWTLNPCLSFLFRRIFSLLSLLFFFSSVFYCFPEKTKSDACPCGCRPVVKVMIASPLIQSCHLPFSTCFIIDDQSQWPPDPPPPSPLPAINCMTCLFICTEVNKKNGCLNWYDHWATCWQRCVITIVFFLVEWLLPF